MGLLEGKIALITGGTSGIGAGTVRHFRAEGAEVVFTGSNAEAAARICSETGAHFVAQRVQDPAGWPPVMDEIQRRFGRLDIAFANAGTEKGDADIEKVADIYHNWRNVGGQYNNVDGLCYNASLDDVRKQDYKLTPGIYVGTEEVEDDGILFEDKMAALKIQLQAQFEKGNALQKLILANFDKL